MEASARRGRRTRGWGCRSRRRSYRSMQPKALQLAGLGAGQRVDELDQARVLVRCDGLLDEVLQRPGHLRPGGVPVAQDDKGLDDLAALRIGHADDAAL